VNQNRRSGFRRLNPGRRLGFKSVLVEPYVQIRLGMYVIIMNLVFSLAFVGVFVYYVLDMFLALSLYFKLDEAESLITWSKVSYPLILCGIIVLCFVVLTFYITVKYTHKIYGPLVNIHSFLDQVLSGENPAPLKLRASDQLNDLAEKINALHDQSKDRS